MDSCVLKLDGIVDTDGCTLCTLDFGAKHITSRITPPDFLPTHPMEWDEYLSHKYYFCFMMNSDLVGVMSLGAR